MDNVAVCSATTPKIILQTFDVSGDLPLFPYAHAKFERVEVLLNDSYLKKIHTTILMTWGYRWGQKN